MKMIFLVDGDNNIGTGRQGIDPVSYTHLSPYKENADLMCDSSLPDEVAVLKPFVVPLLEALPQGCLLYTSRCV